MDVKNVSAKSNVVVISVGQDDVDGMLLNWDLADDGKYDYMENEFISAVMNYLPEYAMGYDTDKISYTNIVDYLRESAKSVIKIKKVNEIKKYLDQGVPYYQWDESILDIYNSKGIFSELILHFLLRDVKGTLPLISKIYFKDSISVEAHGFDAVHIIDDKLWLGETKFYNDGKRGIKALIDDLNKHFKHDYLKEQFMIISRALIHNNEMREEWVSKLSTANRLEDKFSMIYIPLLCIYEDTIASDVIDKLNTARNPESIYFDHVVKMKEYFDKNNTFPNKERVQPLLILLPVKSKDKIVSAMLSRIYNMQNI
jgi:hypothetical protein